MVVNDEEDRERMGAAGTIDTARPSLWRHPFADLMVRAESGAPALVSRLHSTERTRDPLLVARIEAVHRVLLRARVPHVLRVRSVEPAGDDELLVEYPTVHGEGLVNVLRRGPLPLPRALAVLRQVCRSLAAAHAVGIEHHVLGPASIVFLRDDDPRTIGILDYGIAPLYDGYEQSECVELHPITPERVTGGGTERSQDVYLVGCLAYWMLAGEAPFRGDDLATLRRRHAIEDARRLDALAIDPPLPPHIVEAVARALEKDPDDRFASVIDLEAALEPPPAIVTEEIDDALTPIALLPPPRGDTSPRHGGASSGERRVEPSLVFAPGRRREEPRPFLVREREPTVEVEPGTLMRSTALALRQPTLPVKATPVQTRARHPRERRRNAAAIGLTLAVVVAAGVLAWSEEEPVVPAPMERIEIASIAPKSEPIATPPARPQDVPLPPVPGATPPIAEAEPAPRADVPSIEEAIAVVDSVPLETTLVSTTPPRTRGEAAHAKPRVETPAPATEPSSPEPAACDLTRRAAVDARQAHDWSGLLRHTTRASCWRSSDERVALRVKALMELGRFEECAKLGHRVSRPEADVQLWTRVCAKRSGTET
jgi:hypothetical protein